MKKFHSLIIAILLLSEVSFSQTVSFNHIPAWESTEYLTGKISNTTISDQRILVYLYFDGWWWVKPYGSSPLTIILPDSSWYCNVTTGGCDAYADRFTAFIVPDSYTIPGISFQNKLPDELYQFPNCNTIRKQGKRKIEFSGLQWTVKNNSAGCAIGPGPNLFSADTSDIFIDEEQHLHLKIAHHPDDGLWYCSEVIADTSLGYGKYRFSINNRLDTLDKNAVLGLFTWDDYANNNYYAEIDLEASRWGNEADSNFQYVIQPWDVTGNRYRLNVGSAENSIHEFIWTNDTVFFNSYDGENNLFNTWKYYGEYMPVPNRENTRINLWLYLNPPANNNDIEIEIKSFIFQNLIDAPTGINASDGEDTTAVNIYWNETLPGYYYMVYRNTENNPETSTKSFNEWIINTEYSDTTALPGIEYYYWVRASDNNTGSNTTGYSSGYSNYDIGWRKSTVGIIENSKILKIFPNPAKNEINIVLPNFIKWPCHFYIYDLNGNLLYKNHHIENNTNITLPQLADGEYIILFEIDNLMKETVKLQILRK
ncbi:MAG: T9SS type A sorting domain-containing protein [Lentimicrobiaceae bacterium]|nr:T9SS type A sorting domain-containing protein [Lentimicrobiaceae bacterium]